MIPPPRCPAFSGAMAALHSKAVSFNPWMTAAANLRTDAPGPNVPTSFPVHRTFPATTQVRSWRRRGHRVAFSGWLKHLRLVYFENQDPRLTLGNPYRNPFAQFDFAVWWRHPRAIPGLDRSRYGTATLQLGGCRGV